MPKIGRLCLASCASGPVGAALGYLVALASIGLFQGSLGLRLFVLAVALDAFLFAIVCFGNVKHGECASSAAWDLKRQGKWQGRVAVAVIDFLFSPWMKEHCRKSWLWQKDLYK